MSVAQPSPFVHHPVFQNHRLTESICPDCGAFIGASSDQDNLLIAEAAHICRGLIESCILKDRSSPKDLFTMTKADPLVQALIDSESRLKAWLKESELNSDLLRRDPIGAIRAANLGIDPALSSALEQLMLGIARKLNAA